MGMDVDDEEESPSMSTPYETQCLLDAIPPTENNFIVVVTVVGIVVVLTFAVIMVVCA